MAAPTETKTTEATEKRNVGRIEEIQGVVIEAVFPEELPEIYTALIVTREGTENQMRWDRKRTSFMEVWYSTITHAATGCGLWLRYTLTSPDDGDPYCELWAFLFDPSGTRLYFSSQRNPGRTYEVRGPWKAFTKPGAATAGI